QPQIVCRQSRMFTVATGRNLDSVAAMDDPLPSSLQPAYKNRRAGLIVFGVLEILLGAMCGLFIPLVIFGQAMAARHQGAAKVPSLLPVVLVYGFIAIVFVTLGIGSVRCRRWARALLLCIGWIGLCVGIFSLPVMWFALDGLGQQLAAQGRSVPPGVLVFVKIFAAATSLLIYILIPGALVLFYRSRQVRLTCEALDPVPSWTDRCPIPVLCLCVLTAFGSLSVFATLFMYGAAFPMFGTIVQGWAARLLWIAVAAFMGGATLGLFRLKRSTWLAFTGVMLGLMISNFLTFSKVTIIDFYRAAGMPDTEIQMVSQNPLIANQAFILAIMGISGALYIGYLVLIGRYFPKTTNPPLAA
ncbi:MAG: hypothetical protein JWM35_875, partial [Verrucomicrobia bacterium]|nr:hypothetical protein [Verrucomicrobiota bacterium]